MGADCGQMRGVAVAQMCVGGGAVRRSCVGELCVWELCEEAVCGGAVYHSCLVPLIQ